MQLKLCWQTIRQFGTIIRLVYQVLRSLAQIQPLTSKIQSLSFSQPQYSLLYAGNTKSTGNTSCVYLVTVPIAKVDGTLKTVEFVVSTDKTNVASVTYIGELSLAKPDALTDAVARATSALADANQNNQVSAN